MDVTSYMLGKKNGGTTPTGTISITENGEHNVTNYATANVSVEPDLESKSVTITENTTTTITPSSEKDGLSSVSVTTNVSASVEDLNGLNNIIDDFKTKLTTMPTTYETYINSAVTLYTPSLSYPIYFIFKNSSNKYKVAWCQQNGSYDGSMKSNTYGLSSCAFYTTSSPMKYQYSQNRYISDSDYNSVEECIQAIQSNSTTYTYNKSENKYKPKDANSVYATNRYYVNGDTNEFLSIMRISQNETIQAI